MNSESKDKRNIARGIAALRRVAKSKKDEPRGMRAEFMPEAWVAFPWGVAGTAPCKSYADSDDRERRKAFRGGYGVSHILAKRAWEGLDETWALSMVAYTIALGTVVQTKTQQGSIRKELEFRGFHVTLAHPFGSGKSQKPVSWLVTGFEVEEGAAEHSARLPGYAPNGQFINRAEGASPVPKSTPARKPRKVNPRSAFDKAQDKASSLMYRAFGVAGGSAAVQATRKALKAYEDLLDRGAPWMKEGNRSRVQHLKERIKDLESGALVQVGSPKHAINPAAFGTKERRQAFGSHEHGTAGSAERKRKRQAGRKAATRAEELVSRLGAAEAAGKRLTKTQRAALAKAEKRLQAEGALPDDARLRELAAEAKAQDRALDAVLGLDRRTHAVKLALESRPFRRADLEALQEAGWTLRPAGTAPAKVGKALAALNPSDAITRILGPRGEARAVIVQAGAPFGEDLVRALQGDGYDVSPAPKAMREEPARAMNPGQRGTTADTKPRASRNAGGMAKATSKTSKTTGRVRAPKRAPSGSPARKGSKASKPSRPASARSVNPGETDALKRIWKAWTGSDADKVIRLELSEARRLKIPQKLVLLGRVNWLASVRGEDKKFGSKGPLMVTDAKAEKVWLVSEQAHRFDLEPALIGYEAKKPKFGDKGPIEYVHAFRRAHAVMDGQVGALTGTFKITPAGLEG